MGLRRRWMLQPMEIVRIILLVEFQNATVTAVMTTIPEALQQANQEFLEAQADPTKQQTIQEKIQQLATAHQTKIIKAKKNARKQVIQAYPVMTDLNDWDAILAKAAQWEKAGGRYGRVVTPWVRIGALLNAVMPGGVFFGIGMLLTNVAYPLWITPGAFAPLWVAAVVGAIFVVISALIIGFATSKARTTKAEKDASSLKNAEKIEKDRYKMERVDCVKDAIAEIQPKSPDDTSNGSVSLFQDNNPPNDGTWLGPVFDRALFLTPRDIAKIRIKIQQLSHRYRENYAHDTAANLAAGLLLELCAEHPEMQGLSWQEIGTLYGDWSVDHASHGYVRNFQHYLGTILKIILTVASSLTLGYLLTELIYTFVTQGPEVTSILSAPFWLGAVGGIGFLALLGAVIVAYCLADIDTQTSLEVKLVDMDENVDRLDYYTDLVVKEEGIRKKAQHTAAKKLPDGSVATPQGTNDNDALSDVDDLLQGQGDPFGDPLGSNLSATAPTNATALPQPTQPQQPTVPLPAPANV